MSERSANVSGLVWAIAIVAVVASIVGVGWWLRKDSAAAMQASPSTQPATVKADHDYYVFVRLVEFTPRMPGDKTWDSADGSAPDASVILTWRGNRIYTLPDRKDQLIATWDLFRIDVAGLISSGGKIDVASAINAPLVRVTPHESLTIEVWDEDPLASDLALRMDLALATLQEGTNWIAPLPGSGVERLQIDMIPRDTPLPELLEKESARK